MPAAAEQMPAPEEPAAAAPEEITPQSQVAPAETPAAEAQKAPEEIGQPAAPQTPATPVPSIAADVFGKRGRVRGPRCDELFFFEKKKQKTFGCFFCAKKNMKGPVSHRHLAWPPDAPA